MKIKIKFKEKYLDLFSSTAIQLELNNPIYYDATGELAGAYTFPFDVPATNQNRLLFDFLENTHSRASFQRSEKAMIEFEGISLFEGTLVCISASKRSYKIKIVVTPLYDFKSIKLNELDLGSYDLGDTNLEQMDSLTDSLFKPDKFDFSCFPVLNNGIDGLIAITPSFSWPRLFHNPYYYQYGFKLQLNIAPVFITPFLKVNFILKSIFKDFKFSNYLEANDELQKLYLYNNYYINKDSNSFYIDDKITYSNHLPDLPVSDFIKGLQLMFCVGMFKHFSKDEIKFIPMKDILNSSATSDWTNKIARDVVIEPLESKIGAFNFEKSGIDALENDYVEQMIENTFGRREDIADITKASWIENMSLIYKNNEIIRIASQKVLFKKDTTLSVKLGRLEMRDFKREVSTASVYDVPPMIFPSCFVPGSRYDANPKPKCPAKLMFYRGMVDVVNKKYPLASNNSYNHLGQDVYQHSLNWDGEKGLYNIFHKDWHSLTRDGKTLNANINLTSTELYNVDMSEVVHIAGSNFVIKSLKVNLTSEGLKPVEAKLVKIL